MANTKHIIYGGYHNGVQIVELSSWKWFTDYIQKYLADYKQYIFRGHRDSEWKLESTLARAISQRPKARKTTFNQNDFLAEFKAASRGRRGNSPPNLGEDEWWALGQHHGLYTPLLDWTEAPFVALFFAFVKPALKKNAKRAIWALFRPSVESKTSEIRAILTSSSSKSEEPVDIINPLMDDNARLVSQRGIFTRGPDSIPLCKWIEKHFNGTLRSQILIKIEIPEYEGDRAACLQFLNRMNINHLTLFPDLYGASQFCAMTFEIENY